MRATYDEQADAVYCYVTDREVVRTIQVSRHVLLDLDSDYNLRGISVLSASLTFTEVPLMPGFLQDEELDQGEWPLLMPMAQAG